MSQAFPGGAVQGDAGDDQGDAGGLHRRRDLGEHDDADDGGGGRQQRHHQGVGRAGEPRHGELVEHVGDDRGGDAHADAGGQRHRVGERRHGVPAGDRRDQHGGDQHGGGQPVDAAGRPVLGDAVAEDDVAGEQRGVGEGDQHAERLGHQPHVGQQPHARHRQREGEPVAHRAGAERGQDDHGQELDGRHRAQRQAVDGQVEAAVHDRQHGPPAEQRAALPAPRRRERAPGTAPQREHRRGRHDAQEGDAEHLHAREQQHRERRSEVVEDGAHQEVQVGRGGREPVPGPGGHGHTTSMRADMAHLKIQPKESRPSCLRNESPTGGTPTMSSSTP
jgi:hypothetical protein